MNPASAAENLDASVSTEALHAGAQQHTSGPSGPLAGLKVIEICSTIAGPACTRLLADFGADVIKIEPPEGDPVRQMGQHVGDVSLYAASILRNKRSIVLDLKAAHDLQVARALIAQADILVENNRPGVMERLGLGYDTLSQINPGLVMVRISGYGQTGPYAERPGYGAICEAVGGVRHLTGDPDRPPARVALATTDYLSSVYAAFGAVAAIHERGRSGRGQVVDVALTEAAFSQLEPAVPAYEKLGTIPKREGPNLPSMAPNSLYPTRDEGWVLIAANSNPTWKRLVALMQQPELLTDPRFATIQARGRPENMKAIDAIVAQWTRAFDADPLERLLREGEVPCSRVNTIADIYADPHFAARNMLLQVPHATLGHTTQSGIVPRFSRTPGGVYRSGPPLGADSEAVLRDTLGLAPEQIQSIVHSDTSSANEDKRKPMNTPPLDRRALLQWLSAGAASAVLPTLPGNSLAATTAPGWRPSQQITYTVGVAAGGSVDLYARGIKQALESLNLLGGQSMLVENKPGAAGLLSLQPLQRSRGNAHQVASFHTGGIAGQVTGILKADLRDFVPVAMLVEETSLVAVRADSPLKNARDLVDALKRNPSAHSIAVAPIKGQNTHLAIAKPLKVAGVDVARLTVVPFRSSGESMTALLGGHVDVVSATGPTVVPQVLAGKVRILASAAPERGTGVLAQVQTWREQGVDADYVSYNGVLLPPAVDAEQIRFWEQALKQVATAPEWVSLVEKSGNKAIFKGYVDSHRYMQAEFKATQELVSSLGAGAV